MLLDSKGIDGLEREILQPLWSKSSSSHDLKLLFQSCVKWNEHHIRWKQSIVCTNKRMCFNLPHLPDGWGLLHLIWVKKVHSDRSPEIVQRLFKLDVTILKNLILYYINIIYLCIHTTHYIFVYTILGSSFCIY